MEWTALGWTATCLGAYLGVCGGTFKQPHKWNLVRQVGVLTPPPCQLTERDLCSQTSQWDMGGGSDLTRARPGLGELDPKVSTLLAGRLSGCSGG